MDNFTSVIRDAIINYSMQETDFKCQYCGKGYRKESTLVAHLCEPKRRAQQENESGVKLGMTAYLRFYELTQGSAKFKTYADFSSSAYYNAFVKFGRHMVNIRAINTAKFIDWVIKSNKKLDYWCKDAVYQEYLFDHLRKEATQDALERSIKTITTGRISAWVVFNCDSGQSALDKLSTEQIEMIFPYIDPDYWKRKFVDYFADTEWVKHILKEAGL